jgi:2-polyprenyl-6-methoxyphenol hydroxylase-like FAD-dependent oxidoreductase
MNGGPGRKCAVVVGGSLGGLFAGLLLRQAGWHVDIYERVAGELSGRGAGIVVQPALIGRLRALGLNPADLGVSVETRKLFDADGRVAATLRCPQILTAWERVYRFLRDAFPGGNYHRGKALTGISQDADSVVATFGDGEQAEADVLIGADGIRSTVRQLYVPRAAPQYAGYAAWRALLDERDFPPAAHAELFPFMSFGLPPGEQFLGYPVAGPGNDLREGHRRYNVIWYRPAEERTALADLLTDAQGVRHEISIAPSLIRREHIEGMRAAAQRLGRQLREVVGMIREPLLQPIYDLETLSMAFGRVAIVGDAAFVARPHVAAGITKAADDAAALAGALRAEENVEVALKRFEVARLPDNRRMIERARHLGAYLQATKTAEELARSQRHSIPEAVLAETAVLDF